MSDTIETTEIVQRVEVLRPISVRDGMQLLSVADQQMVLTEYDARRKNFIEWLLGHFKQGVHYGFPPGCEAKYDEQGNLLIYSKGGYKPYPTSQWKPKPTIYNTGLRLAQDLLKLRAEYISDIEAVKEFGSPQGMIARRCKLYDANNGTTPVGEGLGIAILGEKGRDANTTIKMANIRALRDAILNTIPMLSELFSDEHNGDAGTGVKDAPQTDESADTQASAKDKAKLLTDIREHIRRSPNGQDAIQATDLIMCAINNELRKERIDTLKELHQVREAIIAGRYDMATGDRIPDEVVGEEVCDDELFDAPTNGQAH